jgi:steroid 5-alpha reductase family enzyme
MTFAEFVWLAFRFNLALCTVLWLASLVKKNVTVVDPFWGFGFLFMVAVLLPVAPGASPRVALVAFLLGVWGLRYGLHILWRPWGHSERDTYYPYAERRAAAGEAFWWRSYFSIFATQAVGTTLIGLPALVALYAAVPSTLTLWDYAGALVWFAGFAFEAVADYQLAVFKREQDGGARVLDYGLWAYSRHPNYFGDAVMWWGVWMVAMATGIGGPTVVAPLLMTYLLVKVSGVPMVESRSKVSRDPLYAEYVRRTSAFVPRPPFMD